MRPYNLIDLFWDVTLTTIVGGVWVAAVVGRSLLR